jgi:hypothetical protein
MLRVLQENKKATDMVSELMQQFHSMNKSQQSDKSTSPHLITIKTPQKLPLNSSVVQLSPSQPQPNKE